MSTRTLSDRIDDAVGASVDVPFSIGRLALRVVSVVSFLAIWWALVNLGITILGFQFSLFVGPIKTFLALLSYLGGQSMTSGGQSIYVHAFYSTMRVVLGVGAATLLGVPIGLLVGTSQQWEDFVSPAMEAIRPIPPVAWVPISVLLFPTLSLTMLSINTSVLFVVFIGAFFPIFVNTVEGVKNVEEEFPRAAKSLGADQNDVFRHVILPATLPSVLTGVSLGIGLGWITVVAAEIVAGNYGLGYVIYQAYRLLQTTNIAVGMISIGALGYASSALVKYLANWIMPWSTVETNR